ncbi:DotU/TssL family secretion system protein [Paraburkholderia sp. B3]|uniref:DotU/TssL family secretion system protein n=1 Tax=Paraburkholderia sp. B3 TaxID=3134791 RepID=UPI0039821C18
MIEAPITAAAASPEARRDTAPEASWLARLRAAEGASNPLLEAARPLLDALLDTPAGLDVTGVEQYRQQLVYQVQQFGKVCATLQLPPPQVDKARYCLCSALDEAATLTDWGNGTATGVEWETNGLASTFGYDRQGRDRIYTIATDCMREPERNHNLNEVIQQIFARGFKGRYRFAVDGKHQIEAVRADIRDAIYPDPQDLPTAPDDIQSLPIPRLPDDLRTDSHAPKSRLWSAVAALCLALLLLAITTSVAHWCFSHVKAPVPVIPLIDALATRLTGRLANEVQAGTITLAENAQRSMLTLRLEGIFEAGESTVNPWVAPMITAIGQEIAKTPGTVLVTGHTDNQPFTQAQSSSNQALSDARAKAVVQILVAAGVATDRVAATGKGNTEPAADNATRQGRTRNRRVDITVSE